MVQKQNRWIAIKKRSNMFANAQKSYNLYNLCVHIHYIHRKINIQFILYILKMFVFLERTTTVLHLT